MTNVDPDAGDVVALVYVAGFALEHGESPGDASLLTPGSTLAETLERVQLADGGTDTYIAATNSTASSPPTCPHDRPRSWRSPTPAHGPVIFDEEQLARIEPVRDHGGWLYHQESVYLQRL